MTIVLGLVAYAVVGLLVAGAFLLLDLDDDSLLSPEMEAGMICAMWPLFVLFGLVYGVPYLIGCWLVAKVRPPRATDDRIGARR